MKLLLIGPELIEASQFIDEVVSRDGITILKCNDVNSCLESLLDYFDGDTYYNYKVLATEIHLTIR